MNFYKLIEQQYKDYKIEDYKKCKGCPCKTLRDIVFGPYKQTGCTDEMAYLIDKYKIDGVNAYLCESRMFAAIKLAKKMSENLKENFNRI